jgi:hypothetical protein
MAKRDIFHHLDKISKIAAVSKINGLVNFEKKSQKSRIFEHF